MKPEDLETVAIHLDIVPDKGFDQGVWSRMIRDGYISLGHHENGYECGMAACVGGHASIMFPDRLRIGRDGGLITTDGALSGMSAFAYTFDLCDLCARCITSPMAPHRTPALAAAALRAMIRGERVCGRYPKPDRCHFLVHDCAYASARKVQ